MTEIKIIKYILITLSVASTLTQPPQALATDSYETDNNYSTARSINMDSSQDHTLHTEGDEDYVIFSMSAGEKYLLETSGSVVTDTVLTLYDTDGTTVLSVNDDTNQLFSQITWPCATSGNYYAKIAGYGGTTTGPYTMAVKHLGYISGTVSDSSSNPVTAGYVDAYSGDPCNGEYVGYGLINPNGTFTIDGLPAGAYYLKAYSFGNHVSEWWADSASILACNDAETVAVTAGETTSGINFQLDTGAQISGTVLDGSSNPVSCGATAAYTGNPCGSMSFAGLAWLNPDGTYTVQALPAGDYYLQTLPCEYLPEWWAASASTLDCAEAETATVTTGGTATGKDFQVE